MSGITGAHARPDNQVVQDNKELHGSYGQVDDNDIEATPTPADEQVEEKFFDSVEIATGPTSFEELDTVREMNEKNSQVSRLSWDAERLMRNVIRSPHLNPKQKEKGIKKVASEFSGRIESVVGKTKEFDFELESAEVLLKQIERASTNWEKLSSHLLKKENKASIAKELSDAIDIARSDTEESKEARLSLVELREKANSMGIGIASDQFNNSITIEKDLNGDYRWVGWVTNNFKDREKDILEEEAHKEFIEYLDNNPSMAPELWAYHAKETACEKQADHWMYENGFVIMSGVLSEKEAQQIMNVQKKYDLGMSHGFFGVRRGTTGEDFHSIKKYRSYEVTYLPVDSAANQWTDFTTILKEIEMSKKQEFLADLIGEDRAEKYMQDTEIRSALLQESGVESKEADVTDDGTPAATPVAPVAEAKDGETTLTQDQIEQVAKALGMEDLSVQFEKLQIAADLLPILLDRIESQEKSTEDALAEAISSPVSKSYAWQRPSEDKSLIVDPESKEGGELMKDVPQAGWLSQATGSESLPTK